MTEPLIKLPSMIVKEMLAERLAEFQTEMESKKAEIAKKQAEVENIQAEVENIQAEIANQQAEIANQKTLIAIKDAEIQRLRDLVNQLSSDKLAL